MTAGGTEDGGHPVVLRDRPTGITYAQLALYGWFLYAFGPTLALLREDEGTTRSVAALHGTGLAIGSITAAFAVPAIVRQIGRGPMLRVGSAVICVGIVMYAGPGWLPLTLAATVVIGAGATFTLVGVNAFLSDHQGPAAPRALSESNGIAALAGLLGPLTVGLGVAVGWGWRPALITVAALLVLLEAARGRNLEVYDGTHGHPDSQPGHTAPGRLPRLYWGTWVVVVMVVGTEFCITLWGSDLLRDRAGLGDAAAAASLATIVGGMAFGRLGGSPIVSRVDPERLLVVAFAVTLAGFFVAWMSSSAPPMLIGFFVAGTGMGLQWPLGVSRALRAAGGRTDRGSAMASVGAGIASGAAPFALGALADAVGVHGAFLLVPGLLLVAMLLVLVSPVPLSLAEPAEAPAP